MKTIRTILIALLLAFASVNANAFDIGKLSVDFTVMQLQHDDETYELLDIMVRQFAKHREVTFLCIDKDLNAVAFRLYQADNGRFIRLRKVVSKTK